MAKVVTIQAPSNKGLFEVRGVVAKLYVGAYQRKFLLQEDGAPGRTVLTHYASGMRIGDLTPIKFAGGRVHERLTDREAARRLLDELVAKHGAERVLETMDRAPVRNR